VDRKQCRCKSSRVSEVCSNFFHPRQLFHFRSDPKAEIYTVPPLYSLLINVVGQGSNIQKRVAIPGCSLRRRKGRRTPPTTKFRRKIDRWARFNWIIRRGPGGRVFCSRAARMAEKRTRQGQLKGDKGKGHKNKRSPIN
jgi:hypothetical protein